MVEPTWLIETNTRYLLVYDPTATRMQAIKAAILCEIFARTQ
jgi:hypothetical protein